MAEETEKPRTAVSVDNYYWTTFAIVTTFAVPGLNRLCCSSSGRFTPRHGLFWRYTGVLIAFKANSCCQCESSDRGSILDLNDLTIHNVQSCWSSISSEYIDHLIFSNQSSTSNTIANDLSKSWLVDCDQICRITGW